MGCAEIRDDLSIGKEHKGQYRKMSGRYRIIFRKFPDRGVVAISAVIIKSKDTYQ